MSDLPEIVKPILQKISGSDTDQFEFWKYLEKMDLTEKFFELSSELMLSDLVIADLPDGYILVTYIFYWETNCQFSGWYALENLSPTLDLITSCYEEVGLKAEATGILKAAKVWCAEKQNYEEVTEAYQSVNNLYNDENKRWEYLNKYFKNNEDSLFYE